MAFPHLYGKEAVINKRDGSGTVGFDVGETVVIVHNETSGKEGRVKYEKLDGSDFGFTDLDKIKVIDETPTQPTEVRQASDSETQQNVIKVSFGDFHVEGTLSDVMDFVTRMQELSQSVVTPKEDVKVEKETPSFELGDKVRIKYGFVEEENLSGFKDGETVVITEIDGPSIPYKISKLDGSDWDWASEDALERI